VGGPNAGQSYFKEWKSPQVELPPLMSDVECCERIYSAIENAIGNLDEKTLALRPADIVSFIPSCAPGTATLWLD
jgi:hypothetical protein